MKPRSKYTRWGTTLREDEARALVGLLRKCSTVRDTAQLAQSAPVQRALAKASAMVERADKAREVA